uniref:THAP-type domain-containing protein n=1 Tax=Culex tarsalis TaxID=7177 RepID=A0A1Q3F1F7_CULTA
MRNCFVPKCDAISRNPSRTMFVVPRKDPDLFRQWQEILPQDRRPLKLNDRVCERHFREEDILRYWQHTINGQQEIILRDKPSLKPRALPVYDHQEMLALIAEAEAQPKEQKLVQMSPGKRKRKNVEETDAGPVKHAKTENIQTSSSASDSSVVESAVHKINGTIEGHAVEHNIIIEVLAHPDFETLYDEVYEVELPTTLWGIHRDLERTFIAFTEFSKDSMNVRKYLYIDQSLQYRMTVGQRTMKSGTLPAASTEAITELLTKLDEIKVRKVIIKGSSSVLNES